MILAGCGSYVLEGHLGAQLGDGVVYAEAGDLAFKPCDQWHTFWNTGDGTAPAACANSTGWCSRSMRVP